MQSGLTIGAACAHGTHGVMTDKIYRYWVAVPSGLEAVALDELHEHAPEVQQVDVEPGGRVGQIFFTYKRSPGGGCYNCARPCSCPA